VLLDGWIAGRVLRNAASYAPWLVMCQVRGGGTDHAGRV
jgi:hypothetical protein